MEKIISANGVDFHVGGEGLTFANVARLSEEADGAVELYEISLAWEKEGIPSPVTVSCDFVCRDVYSVRLPREIDSRVKYDGAGVSSRLGFDTPSVQMIGKNGENRLTVSLSDCLSPIRLSLSCVLDTFHRRLTVTLFRSPTGPFREYRALLRFDRTSVPFYEAAKNTRAWYREIGYVSAKAPAAAFDPVYSTWYSYLQKVRAEDVLRECREAVRFGLKTVILDDGWQKDDSPTVYGYTGDWKPCGEKFPDMKKLSEELHAIGMKFMIWFSVPFVGEYAERYRDFAGKYLNEVPGCFCSVLDPRYREVREFIVSTYVDALEKWDPDGFKLDFIDRFKTNGEWNEAMDFVSVETATERLLREIYDALTSRKPDILIEFRQPYAGMIPQRFGNMFRVWDCPNDGYTNRVGTLNLRLLCDEGAVHSDMIGAEPGDTPESFAGQLIGTLFSVPQISVRFSQLSDAHRAVLRTYLDFWTAHRETLTRGKLRLTSPALSFGLAEAEDDRCHIAVNVSGEAFLASYEKENCLFNLSEREYLPVNVTVPSHAAVTDCQGTTLVEGDLPVGVSLVPVPLAGMLRILRTNE